MLPELFLQRMQTQLGEEFEEYLIELEEKEIPFELFEKAFFERLSPGKAAAVFFRH